MSDLSKIGLDFSRYLASLSPQVDNNSLLQWYLSGSLATTMLAEVESITEIQLNGENKIIGETETKHITEAQREKIGKFSRKLGNDIDIINVNGNLFRSAPVDNKPHIQNVIKNVPNVLDLMSWNVTYGGSMYIDSLEADREIKDHHVAKVKTANGVVYVTAPPEQLAHKIAETIWLSGKLNDKPSEETKGKYKKDIKDLTAMFYGFKDLYGDELIDRVYNTLNEKDGSLFSLSNVDYTQDNIDGQLRFFEENIMGKIKEHSLRYLKVISGNSDNTEIEKFFNELLDKRKLDVEKTYFQKKKERLSAIDDDLER